MYLEKISQFCPRGEAFTCLRQFLTYRAVTITLTMILGLSQKLS